MTNKTLRTLCATTAAALLLATTTVPARAHQPASELSAISMLPVALVVSAPAALLSGGAMLTVVAVEASAEGTMWVLERASDGARASLKLAGASATAVGTGLLVTAMSAGWVLSAAGQAIAFIPNEIGASLLHNERVTR
ncbi:MAG: hypothetical protein HY855_10860 [Burkholderiales bacterium]|nr:hypothetical protein [Burkholderiales bacterium]